MRYEVWIDRGGTFTDCILLDRDTGTLQTVKVPSSDQAPLAGIRRLLGLEAQEAIPPCAVRLSTTLATNALLERRGVRSALAITRGFGDLLRIGDQTRPDLFALGIEPRRPLPAAVLEVSARALADGSAEHEPDWARLADELRALRTAGCESLAVAVLNDHRTGVLERRIAEVARAAGFGHVALASELTPELGLLARAETAALDAYLTPLLARGLAKLTTELEGSRLHVLQSSGELTPPERVRGPGALLSGPAGGVVACARLAEEAGLGPVIGFDMGGTSTDVSRSDGGRLEHVFESVVAGVRVRAPILAVTTVAAGGGSICRFDGLKLTVGPESAGAIPGPLCYGHPDARELTITDVNLALGRLAPERFPFPLLRERAVAGLEAVRAAMANAGFERSFAEVGAGFLEIANRAMAEAIRQVSVKEGHDVRKHALVALGGAGGQHASELMRQLGLTETHFHPLAGVLAAFGLGLCDVGWRGARELGSAPLDDDRVAAANTAARELEAEGRRAIGAELREGARLVVDVSFELRYAGTETSLAFAPAAAETLRTLFHARHSELFGHARPEHRLELVTVRVGVAARRAAPVLPSPVRRMELPPPRATTRLFAAGEWHPAVPVYDREDLPAGLTLHGPLLVREATGTIVLDPGFTLTCRDDGILTARAPAAPRVSATHAEHARPDPVLLEVLGRRFMSIAEQMGHLLRRTALSTNIRERLDFSCALFDPSANLVANAPHIPVHLGAMSESVRACVARFPDLRAGDVFVTNDPALGGSHLPDITVVTPIHHAGRLAAFAACRGHHADIGGITPGSMPPDATRLDEEGVVLAALRVVRDGRLDESSLSAALRAGRYPARRPADNLADLRAQVAAVGTGSALFGELASELGLDLVASYMHHLQHEATARVTDWIRLHAPREGRFVDALDDGTPIAVTLTASHGRLKFDFSGSGGAHPKNLNAPRSVTVAAVLYTLRVLAGGSVPLNAGCLAPIELVIPEPSLLAAAPGAAVAAGNVETSQRVVDVLLAVTGAAAASQGTMNNLSFGDASFGYYETIGGGAGAGPSFAGASAVHTHMTNTRLTDPEVLESRFPVRVRELSVRRGSGGDGRFRGGDGLCRELEFLAPLTVTMISERRALTPFGLAGGACGRAGRNTLNGDELPGSFTVTVRAGDVLRIETPGGGGYGPPERPALEAHAVAQRSS